MSLTASHSALDTASQILLAPYGLSNSTLDKTLGSLLGHDLT